MINSEKNRLEFISWLSVIVSIIGLIVAIWSIGGNSFLYKENVEECIIEDFQITEFSYYQYLDDENVDILLEAIQREKIADNIYCSSSKELFGKKADLEIVIKVYREIQKTYFDLKLKNKELDNKIKDTRKKLVSQEQNLISELDGTGGSRKVGMGVIYKREKEVYDKFKVELDSLSALYEQREIFYSNLVTSLDKKIEMIRQYD